MKDQWSTRAVYFGEQGEYPIAQAAVHAIAKLGALTSETTDRLYQVAIDTTDSALRYQLLELMAKSGGPLGRAKLFDLACAPGRLHVRQAAATALLAESDEIEQELIGRITPELLVTRVEPVSALFAILLSLRADPQTVSRAAEVLATNRKRRVFLVLLAGALSERDRDAAKRIANILPAKNPAVALALGDDIGDLSEDVLDDLGDPVSVAEVLHYVKPKKT